MAPITENTLLDQETGYSSLSEATPLKEHKSSWRRSGVAAAVLSALALGAVAAVKTTSAKRGSQPTAFYPKVSISNPLEYKVYGTVSYGDPGGLFCKHDDYSVAPKAAWTASSRGACLVTKITASVEYVSDDFLNISPWTSQWGTTNSQFTIDCHQLPGDLFLDFGVSLCEIHE